MPLSIEAQICDLYKEIEKLKGKFPYLKNARGEWNGQAVYEYNDWVTVNGSSYLYINHVASMGIAPTNTAYWQLIAARGAQGSEITEIASGTPEIVGNQTKTPVTVRYSPDDEDEFEVYAQNGTNGTIGHDGAIQLIGSLTALPAGVDMATITLSYPSTDITPYKDYNEVAILLTGIAAGITSSFKAGDIVKAKVVNILPEVNGQQVIDVQASSLSLLYSLGSANTIWYAHKFTVESDDGEMMSLTVNSIKATKYTEMNTLLLDYINGRAYFSNMICLTDSTIHILSIDAAGTFRAGLICMRNDSENFIVDGISGTATITNDNVTEIKNS